VTITHGLGTADIVVSVHDLTGGTRDLTRVDITAITTTTLKVTSATPAAAGDLRIVVFG
jgi:hypothetical protein